MSEPISVKTVRATLPLFAEWEYYLPVEGISPKSRNNKKCEVKNILKKEYGANNNLTLVYHKNIDVLSVSVTRNGKVVNSFILSGKEIKRFRREVFVGVLKKTFTPMVTSVALNTLFEIDGVNYCYKYSPKPKEKQKLFNKIFLFNGKPIRLTWDQFKAVKDWLNEL